MNDIAFGPMSDHQSETTEDALLTATSQILKPLMRVLLRNGIACAAMKELMRRAAVGVAREEFGLDGKSPTQARISVITGLSRKEVARLLNELETAGRVPVEERRRAAIVLSAWRRDPDFCDEHGEPLRLPFSGDISFAELCKRHSGDMKPRSIADELVDAGALEEADGFLSLTTGGYVPAKDPVGLLRILGTDAAEFLETIDHNLRAREGETRLFQSKVHYDNLPAGCKEEFRRYSAERTHALLVDLDRWLSARDRGDQPADGEQRISLGLGAFHIVGDSPYDDDSSGSSADPRPENN